MEFTNRQTYLAAVQAWKQAYAEHSELVRIRKKQHHIQFPTWSTQKNLDEVKLKATEMISERHASKVKAQEQYLASRA